MHEYHSQKDLIPCPNCGEEIKAKATVCRYCQYGLSDDIFRPCPSCSERIRREAKLCRFCKSNIIQPSGVPSGAANRVQSGKKGQLFHLTDDAIDQIFSDHLGVKDSSIQPFRSSRANERLAPMKDISDPGSSGRIASIGKFLWDNRDIEKIRNLAWGDPPFAGWHTLTAEADMELKLTLKPLDSRKQILGSVIIGRDNLVITHTLPEATEAELVAVFSLACDLNVQITLKKLGTHRINQTVMKTNEWYLLTCRFDSGLLVSLCEMITIKELSRLIRKQQTTAIEIERILRKLFE